MRSKTWLATLALGSQGVRLGVKIKMPIPKNGFAPPGDFQTPPASPILSPAPAPDQEGPIPLPDRPSPFDQPPLGFYSISLPDGSPVKTPTLPPGSTVRFQERQPPVSPLKTQKRIDKNRSAPERRGVRSFKRFAAGYTSPSALSVDIPSETSSESDIFAFSVEDGDDGVILSVQRDDGVSPSADLSKGSRCTYRNCVGCPEFCNFCIGDKNLQSPAVDKKSNDRKYQARTPSPRFYVDPTTSVVYLRDARSRSPSPSAESTEITQPGDHAVNDLLDREFLTAADQFEADSWTVRAALFSGANVFARKAVTGENALMLAARRGGRKIWKVFRVLSEMR